MIFIRVLRLIASARVSWYTEKPEDWRVSMRYITFTNRRVAYYSHACDAGHGQSQSNRENEYSVFSDLCRGDPRHSQIQLSILPQ